METAATATSISQELRSENDNLQELFFSYSSVAEQSHDSGAQPGCGPASNGAAKQPDVKQFLEHHFFLSETLETGII